MQDLRITLVQTNQFWQDKQANLSHFETTFLNQISPESTDLILLPEMFNTSFSMEVEKLAEPMTGPSIEWLKVWAAKLKTQIGGSLIVQEGTNYYNRFVIVSAEGVQTFYDKRHLFRMANENEYFIAGDKRVVYELNGWKLKLQVCYDLRFPVFSRNRKMGSEKEYDVLLFIANWPEKRSSIWKNLLISRAIENQVYVIGVNRVGKDGKEITYSGDSALIDPWGNKKVEIPAKIERMEHLILNKDVLDAIKEQFPSYLDSDEFDLLVE